MSSQGYNPEVIGDVGAGEAVAEQGGFLRGTRLGNILALTGATLAMVGGEALNAEAAEATVGGNSNSVITDTQTGITVRSAHGWQKDGDFSKVIVMGNYRSVSRAEVEEARQEGECFWVNGKKEEVYVEGVTADGVGMGRDTRKSEFCEVDEDVNGDGKVNDEDIVRAKCGNFAVIGEKPEGALESVIWVEGKGKIRVDVESEAKAWANCTTSDGLASAGAEGSAKASASGFLKMKGSIKSIVRKAQGKINQLVEKSLSGKGMAKSKAHAVADAQCTEGTAPVPTKPPTPGNTPPSVDLIGPQHVLTGGVIDVCAYGRDANFDIVSQSFSETGNGNFISAVYKGDEAGEFCQTYKAGTEADDATITATVTDAANQSASDSESFPIVGSEDPRGQF